MNVVNLGKVVGENGKSAYEIWLEQGNEGTEQDFLNSLGGGGASSNTVILYTNDGYTFYRDENNTDEIYPYQIFELMKEKNILISEMGGNVLSVVRGANNATYEIIYKDPEMPQMSPTFLTANDEGYLIWEGDTVPDRRLEQMLQSSGIMIWVEGDPYALTIGAKVFMPFTYVSEIMNQSTMSIQITVYCMDTDGTVKTFKSYYNAEEDFE